MFHLSELTELWFENNWTAGTTELNEVAHAHASVATEATGSNLAHVLPSFIAVNYAIQLFFASLKNNMLSNGHTGVKKEKRNIKQLIYWNEDKFTSELSLALIRRLGKNLYFIAKQKYLDQRGEKREGWGEAGKEGRQREGEAEREGRQRGGGGRVKGRENDWTRVAV